MSSITTTKRPLSDLQELTGLDRDLLSAVLLDNKNNEDSALRPVVVTLLGGTPGTDLKSQDHIFRLSGLQASIDEDDGVFRTQKYRKLAARKEHRAYNKDMELDWWQDRWSKQADAIEDFMEFCGQHLNIQVTTRDIFSMMHNPLVPAKEPSVFKLKGEAKRLTDGLCCLLRWTMGYRLGYLNWLQTGARGLTLKIVNQSTDWDIRALDGESWALWLVWDFFSVAVTTAHLREGLGVPPLDLTARRTPGYLQRICDIQKAALLTALQQVCTERVEPLVTVAMRLRACAYDWFYIYGPTPDEYAPRQLEDIEIMVKLMENLNKALPFTIIGPTALLWKAIVRDIDPWAAGPEPLQLSREVADVIFDDRRKYNKSTNPRELNLVFDNIPLNRIRYWISVGKDFALRRKGKEQVDTEDDEEDTQ